MGVILCNFLLLSLLGTMAICQDCSYPTNKDLEDVIKKIITSQEEHSGSSTSVDVARFNVVCLAFGNQKDLYRAVSVVVEYMCSGNNNCPVAIPVVEQIESECDAGNWSTVSSVQDSTDNTHSPVHEADFSTVVRENCSLCLSPVMAWKVSLTTDPGTHCVACDWTCDRGHGRCFGLAPSVCQESGTSSSSCCNFYFNSTCVHDCPGSYIGDANNDCVCPIGTTGLNCDEVIDCRCLVNPGDGVVVWTNTTYNSIATYSCDTGHMLVGDETRTCSESGVWSGSTPICTVVDCGHLEDPPHGTVSLTTAIYNSMATYSCNTGYTVDGHGERICLENGQWSGDAPTCSVVDCGLLKNIQNGMVFSLETVYSSVATYTCNEGYVLMGITSRECLPSGEWSGNTPNCSKVNCGGLEDQEHGSVEVCDTTYNSVATYFCNAGYTLMGNNMRTCLANGDWSDSKPSCIVISCDPLQSPEHGTVSVMTRTYNSVATYTCETGYNIVKDSDRTCLEDGEWSGETPTCMEVDCGNLQHPANGRVLITTTTYSSDATYSCNNGYYLNPPIIRTCLAEGRWSGSSPTCKSNSEESQSGNSDQCHEEVVGGLLGPLLFISIVLNVIIAVYLYHSCKKAQPNNNITKVMPAKAHQLTQPTMD